MLYLLFLIPLCLAFNGNSNSNVAVYWGQNSAGNEQSLATYCQSSNIDIVLLSFMNGFPTLELNFGGECNEQFSDGLLHCSTIAQDIKTCQSLGKKVLLSLGGAVGTYGFTGDSDGSQFAQTLWNKFGGGSDNERPFDDAIVDGFDFDIENQNQAGYVALANSLRQFFSQDSSKQYYLSAAPQCVYPDASVGDLLSQANIDFAFIQFYNNYCSLDGQFNWDTWKDFATNTSPNKNIKLFVGLPGQASSAGSGYIDSASAVNILNQIKSDANFGGVSFWDASSVYSNGNYLETIKSALQGSTPQSQPSVSSSAAIANNNPGPSSITSSVAWQPTTVQSVYTIASAAAGSQRPSLAPQVDDVQSEPITSAAAYFPPTTTAVAINPTSAAVNSQPNQVLQPSQANQAGQAHRHTYYVTEYAYQTVYIQN